MCEWLAINIVDFYNALNSLYGEVAHECTPQSCRVMNAGPKYEYLWADGIRVLKPMKVPACQYVDYLFEWVADLFEDESVFPQDMATPFPPYFKKIINRVYARFFRVYAHMYYSHFALLVRNGLEAQMNSSFKHFYYFGMQFQLIDEKEVAPLRALIVNLTRKDNSRYMKLQSGLGHSRGRLPTAPTGASTPMTPVRPADPRPPSSLPTEARPAAGTRSSRVMTTLDADADDDRPSCFACGSVLSGGCPMFEGKEFCSSCFVCTVCRRDMKGEVECISIDAEPYCASCGEAAWAERQGGATEEEQPADEITAAGDDNDSITVDSVYPMALPLDGGFVTLQGRGMKRGARVTVNDAPCSSILVSGDGFTVEMRAPAMSAPGSKRLEVCNPDGTSAILDGVLQYLPPPTLLSFFEDESFYHGTLSSGQAEAILAHALPGTYLVRWSERQQSPVISWMDTDRHVTHSIVQRRGLTGLGLEGNASLFEDLPALLRAHEASLRRPLAKDGVVGPTAVPSAADFFASKPKPTSAAPSPTSSTAHAVTLDPQQEANEIRARRERLASLVQADQPKVKRGNGVYATQTKLDVKNLRAKFG